MLHIPPYAIIIFFILFYIGIKSCSIRIIQPIRLYIFPALMAFLCSQSLQKLFPDAHGLSLIMLLIMLIIVALIGYKYASYWQIQSDVVHGMLTLPATRIFLLIDTVTITSEYILHYAVQTHSVWAQNQPFMIFSFMLWGGLLGLSIGLAVNVLVRYNRDEIVQFNHQ